MLENIDLTNILTIDIETVPVVKNFEDLDERWKQLWRIKSAQKFPELNPESSWPQAGAFAEFGKIICISAGAFVRWGKTYQYKIKSYCSDDETIILNEFNDMLEKYIKTPANTLAAHNGREYDYPYIARRMMINKIEVPLILDLGGRRPWEINLIDTLEMWKFGDFKSACSLDLLGAAMDVPVPETDMDEASVYTTYYNQQNLEKIKLFCQRNTIMLGRLLLRFKKENDIPNEFIGYIK